MASPFHPDLRSLARWLPRGVGTPLVATLARLLPTPTQRPPEGVTITERRLGAATVRLVEPTRVAGPRPALLWIHGGGYVIGSAKQDDALCARFAQRLGATVVSVDYRLAPRHPFPAPLDDCFAAWEFIHREAGALGIDPRRVALGGQSAGGGLAAALAQRVTDHLASAATTTPAPCFQLLVYPMLDDRTGVQAGDGAHHRLWNAASNRYGWASYLGRAPGSDDVPRWAAPARRTELRGLPPAWVGVGTLDLFHDEDLAYAARLRDAGVVTELELVPGAFHGFDAVAPGKAVSQAFFDAQVKALARAFG